ncbi:MAG TPA: hypothetical protein VFL66_02235 [Gaiellaceae bacterium]|nr:hypothetical protein [Gaiellaceae bacterium]
MKLKAFAFALLLAALPASVAFADNGHGKHGAAALTSSTDSTTTTTTGDDGGSTRRAKPCRPSIQLELAGTAASAPSGGSLALLVEKGGAQGQQLNGKQLTLDVSGAKVEGTAAAGGSVRVHARACVDLVAGTVKIVASQVRFAGAKGHGGSKDDDGSTSSSTSTTTTG